MTSSERRGAELSLLCYRQLLRVYPRPFLDRFGEELLQTFEDLARGAIKTGGNIRLLIFCAHIFPDILRSAFHERIHSNKMTAQLSSIRKRWIMACGIGFLLAKLGGDVLHTPTQVANQWARDALCFGLALGWMQSSWALNRTKYQSAIWILVTTAGIVLFSQPFLYVISAGHYRAPELTILGVVLVSALRGLGLGLAQFFLIRKQLSRAWAWIPANIFGFFAGWYAMLDVKNLNVVPEQWMTALIPFVTGIAFGYVTSIPMDSNPLANEHTGMEDSAAIQE